MERIEAAGAVVAPRVVKGHGWLEDGGSSDKNDGMNL
jgi:hypothetical protein